MNALIAHDELEDRINGCWLGKSIGGAIGAPYEGQTFWLDVPKKYPARSVENDDLDLQLVWLHVLEQKGVGIAAPELAQGWIDHITYPFDEYGVAVANLQLGLKPPYTGICNNYFKNCMGSPIRSEIWACLFPGQPATAGWYAMQDAQVDHWDEGVYGEIFFSCQQSAAFTAGSIEETITQGLKYIPVGCGVARAVRQAVELHRSGIDIQSAQRRILQAWADDNFTHCLQNIAFTILGLLYGKGDLLETIILATSCGSDTDCTAATAGALIGILQGGKKILAEAGAVAGSEIIAGGGIHDCNPPATTFELTRRVLALLPQASEYAAKRQLPAGFTLPEMTDIPHPYRIGVLRAAADAPVHGEGKEPLLTGDAVVEEVAGNFLPVAQWFEQTQKPVLLLQTSFCLPQKRKLRVLPVFAGEERMWLDSKLVLDQKKWRPFMPAPHRCSTDVPLVELEAGEHRITLEIWRPGVRTEYPFALLLAHESLHLMTDVSLQLQAASCTCR